MLRGAGRAAPLFVAAAGMGLDSGRADAGRTLLAFRILAADDLVHDKRVGSGSGRRHVAGAVTFTARQPREQVRFGVIDLPGALGLEVPGADPGESPLVQCHRMLAQHLGGFLHPQRAPLWDVSEGGAVVREYRSGAGGSRSDLGRVVIKLRWDHVKTPA